MDSKPNVDIYDQGIQFILEMMSLDTRGYLLELMIKALITIQTQKEMKLMHSQLQEMNRADVNSTLKAN